MFFFYEIYDDEAAYKAHGDLENRERVFYATIDG